ncbi:FdhF/YdeP family oxidoreductase [Cytophagaceae bacterium YF14B1]|uniref:FdhF/YdeP family oxidoreductase n=1 Tax=Xanthocytophaga flava TaxID=3048013 RepID=A0AAE3QQK7_9BACT|nr:FdhF/YdeP family oxidoreductase [Xanthocytophaga flavus]MDJ1483051.1 FdhF/YdeP family oxidoreductase [Xanthocytophaga flavus]
MSATNKPHPYKHPAGNFAALTTVLKRLSENKSLLTATPVLAKLNKHGGVDCPSCAWPDPKKTHFAEFCENGAKAIASETTTIRANADFFRKYTVSELYKKDGYWLEQQGRLTEPMWYNAATDHYEPISWQNAFQKIAQHLNKLPDPNQALFYTSGRASNESAFLFQLFAREYGTNNMPDCSNMCHEATSVALAEVVGVGKSTIELEDYEKADTIFIFGQNPGTNHPRMLTDLEKANQRGCNIIAVNPLKEAALESFIHPQHVTELLLQRSSKIATQYMQVHIGGDLALLKGLIKYVLEAEAKQPGQIDKEFIEQHTVGFEALKEDIENTSWGEILSQSGIYREEIVKAAQTYLNSKNTIFCWCMGVTQNKHAVLTIQYLVNLALLKGNIGRPGAGLAPVRGHSNVQGNRTVGITDNPPKKLLEGIEKIFGFTPPAQKGYNTVEAMNAMYEGKAGVFIGLAGNFISATPDTAYSEAGMRKCDLTVHISTKPNHSHFVTGKEALILPCLGRTEIDVQNGISQQITVEDSNCMVHASEGHNKPASEHLKSECAIIAGMAQATLPQSKVSWDTLVKDYSLIRTKIAEVLPEFANYNQLIQQPGGFYLRPASSKRVWNTKSGKAQFTSGALPNLQLQPSQLTMATIRSHDQFNTTIYGLEDRYRNIHGERDVIFMHPEDMEQRGIQNFDRVDITSYAPDGSQRQVHNFKVVPYDIPKGCVATYYPEANPLVPVSSYADGSMTPSSKYVVVTVQKTLHS